MPCRIAKRLSMTGRSQNGVCSYCKFKTSVKPAVCVACRAPYALCSMCYSAWKVHNKKCRECPVRSGTRGAPNNYY